MEESGATQPLAALEYRLRRLEHYLVGDFAHVPQRTTNDKGKTIHARLESLERGLNSLSKQSVAVRQLLHLQTKYPDLFHPSSITSTSLPPTEQLAIINASAPSFQETSSRLKMLKDLPIPSPSQSTQLIALAPRIAKAQKVQRAQGQEIAELRAKSAVLMEKWYEVNVLGMGECWAEWEGRMEEAEKRVRRREREVREEKKEGEAYRGE